MGALDAAPLWVIMAVGLAILAGCYAWDRLTRPTVPTLDGKRIPAPRLLVQDSERWAA